MNVFSQYFFGIPSLKALSLQTQNHNSSPMPGFTITNIFDDGTENLGGGYSYAYDSSLAVHGPKIDVPPKIMDIKYDRRFIIVKQRLNDKKSQREYYDSYNYNYPSLYGDYYWIIDNQEDAFHGPMDSLHYIRKTDSLGIRISKMKRSGFLK